jgi:hypothetical protein
MDIPKAGERVYVGEFNRIFIVASVYQQTLTADLLPVGSGPIKEDVPWRRLFRCWPSPAERINATPRWG